METSFLILLIIHGLIHLLGFIKGFNLTKINQLVVPISRLTGVLWLISAVLFLLVGALLTFNISIWWIVALLAVVFSQILIIRSWKDAMFGTVANAIIFIPVFFAFLNFLPSSFSNIYRAEVQKGLTKQGDTSVVTEADLKNLPPPVKKYLLYAGVVGKPKVYNFRAVFTGTIKPKKDGDWFEFHAQQYDFFNYPTRVFLIKSSMFRIPFDGLHLYIGKNATMQIRIGSLIQIADAKGDTMTQSETVTLFNDMCILAPAALILPSIQWEAIDSTTTKAIFSNEGHTISAILHFNEVGELINFVSDDRKMSFDGITYEKFRWSTPINNYKDFNDRKVATYGKAIWNLPGGQFMYGKFDLVEIEYNCKELK
jgi:hypothetical protein